MDVNFEEMLKVLGVVNKFFFIPLFILLKKIWDSHVEDNKKNFNNLSKLSESQQKKLERLQSDIRIYEKFHDQGMMKVAEEIKKNISEEKKLILLAVEKNGNNIDSVKTAVSNLRLETAEKIHALETEVEKIKQRKSNV
jgi:hypothetical protein